MQKGNEQVFSKKVLVSGEFVQIAVFFDRLGLMSTSLRANQPENLRLIGVVNELEPGILKCAYSARLVGEDLDGLI